MNPKTEPSPSPSSNNNPNALPSNTQVTLHCYKFYYPTQKMEVRNAILGSLEDTERKYAYH